DAQLTSNLAPASSAHCCILCGSARGGDGFDLPLYVKHDLNVVLQVLIESSQSICIVIRFKASSTGYGFPVIKQFRFISHCQFRFLSTTFTLKPTSSDISSRNPISRLLRLWWCLPTLLAVQCSYLLISYPRNNEAQFPELGGSPISW